MADKDEIQTSTDVERAESVREVLGARAIIALVPGSISLVLGVLMAFLYPGLLQGLGWVLLVLGLGAIGYGIYALRQTREVKAVNIICPYCQAENHFTVHPRNDIRCVDCSRNIPIRDGQVLQVYQVQCGYCQHLNYYSDKSSSLVCENCDSVIPIATDEEAAGAQVLAQFARREDNDPYDLVLLTAGPKPEKMIECLQHMLALNRNQVKQIIAETPVTLMTGIPRKKAELLSGDIRQAGGRAEINLTETSEQGTS
ncbi:MAG: hypothetical protein MH204_11250 [Fimbriimonadaceae bacterium]|nr:hypothetical protein [Fimbriimonadaceae bacterium]